MSDSILKPENRFTWTLLAFQGGFINVGGLLTVHIFVSHITGFSAHFSLEVFNGSLLKAAYFILVPIFFLVGAFFSGFYAEIRKKNHEQPVYIHILSILTFLYILVTVLGVSGYFGVFGEPFQNFRDFILLSILAFSCGAQNAIFTHYSKSIIRTTHLTGITTDLGIGLAKQFISKDKDEAFINKIRLDLIISFILGSLVSVGVFSKIKFFGFLVPAFISLFVGIRLYLTRK